MNHVRIDDLSDERLDTYRDLRTNNTTRDQRLFIAEGSTVARRLFESHFETVSALVSDKKWPRFHEHIPEGVTVYRVSHDIASELVGFDFHVGILAAGRRQTAPSLAEILAGRSNRQPFIVAPHITDAENVGALIRIGAAFGCAAIILGPGCSDPFSRRVLRVSMANGLYYPVIQVADIAETLRQLQDANIRCYATVLDPSARPLEHIDPREDVALVFGNETHGLADEVIQHCDDRLTIPMHGGTDSLNVAVSAGIFLHWFSRGRSS